ncbi:MULTISPECIES: hypothetical protein [Sphingobacterium]|uniref:hypothetical protein n=1 Tax=Sphingobacterium TaxID=28453 RepID=UPI00257C297E|nr:MULTISPECIES: hypothetical protein [Sphingobacterium]
MQTNEIKVAIIANILANGRVLYAENPNYETLAEAMNFYVGFVRMHLSKDEGQLRS